MKSCVDMGGLSGCSKPSNSMRYLEMCHVAAHEEICFVSALVYECSHTAAGLCVPKQSGWYSEVCVGTSIRDLWLNPSGYELLAK